MTADPFDPAPGAGERAQRRRQRQLWIICAALAIFGFFTGLLASRLERDGGAFLEGIPPEFAIAFCVIWTGAIMIGGWRYHKATDELDRANHRFAAVMAFNAYLTGYPVWYVLWRGGLVSEPSHAAIFVALYVAMILLYLWKKLRT